MSKQERSWRRPLGMVLGIAIALSAAAATAAVAGEKAGGRPHREDRQVFDVYPECQPVSHGRSGDARPSLVLRLGDRRFYWNRSARLFVPFRWVDHRFGRRAPDGTEFLNPFSGERFRDLLRYVRRLEDRRDPPVLDIIRLPRRPDRGWRRPRDPHR